MQITQQLAKTELVYVVTNTDIGSEFQVFLLTSETQTLAILLCYCIVLQSRCLI